jgi:hypothetical protein
LLPRGLGAQQLLGGASGDFLGNYKGQYRDSNEYRNRREQSFAKVQKKV